MRLLFPLLLASAVAACATPTPYQPLAREGGYSLQRIEADRYRVSFAGNSSTPRETVDNYLLLRAAELTLEQGYDFFVLDDFSTEADTRYTQTVEFLGGVGHYRRWPHGGSAIGVGTSTPVTRYQALAYVSLFAGERPATQTRAFDARAVRDNLAPLAVLPTP